MGARSLSLVCTLVALFGVKSAEAAFIPWATEVVSYTPGTNAASALQDPISALGEPSRTNGTSAITPFSASFQTTDLVSIGAGGELTVAFDHPVTDDPLDPFGVDLLVFGNAFFTTSGGTASGGIFGEPGLISVSQNGTVFFEVLGVFADDLFPTMGFTDSPGTIPTDFTRPVDPLLTAGSFTGLDLAGISLLYDGSGGGAGVDISTVGLDWIQFVRVSQPASDAFSTEVAGFADVAAIPEPSILVLLGLSLAVLSAVRRSG